MEYLAENLSQTLIVFGLILLAIEVLVLGFSTFVLFFLGLGFTATGILMTFDLIPETILTSLLATAIIATVIAIFSWKPMKILQNKAGKKQVSNDIIGHQFTLTEALIAGQTSIYRYSGIDWKITAAQPLPAGTQVKIIAMEVGLLTVEQVR